MPTELIDTGLAPYEQDDQFEDLLWSDRQWLREQFDEIIAAEWPQQPPDPPRSRAPVAHVPSQNDAHGGNTTADVSLPDRSPTPQIDRFAWQRSPPTDPTTP
ncbi:MAG: hypothetical protein ABI206_15425 [Antricoccus sp.]